MKRSMLMGVVGIMMALGSPAHSEETDVEWKQRMEKQVDALSRELEKSKLGAAAEKQEPVYQSTYGLSPAASKVYHVNRGVSLGGYGEMVLREFDNERDDGAASGSRREIDFVRAILYTGYKFSDKILFNSELEYEHGSTGNSSTAQTPRGEVSVEFAYLDFLVSRPIGLRAGLVLVPMGFINELHEPTVYHGAVRPSVEQNLIPSTWRDNGVGVVGSYGPFSYRSYVLAGLQATNGTGISGFSASSGLRGGRSKGAKSYAEDVAWVGRLDYEGLPGTVIGGSVYAGQAGQNATVNAQEVEAPVTLWEAHGEAALRGIELRALYAQGTIGDVSLINRGLATSCTSGTCSVGERLFGGYAQLAYNILSLVDTAQYLAPFVRYERYDTQARVPAGYTKNPANSRTEYTVGLTYKPIPHVVVKGEWQDLDNQAGTGVNQVNFALGYIF